MTRQPKNYRCPCCGHPMEQPGVDKPVVTMGPNQQALFNLLKANPDGISAAAIRDRVFTTNRDGDPHCHNIVAVVTANVNKKIKAWGLRISSTGGPGSVYRLVRE